MRASSAAGLAIVRRPPFLSKFLSSDLAIGGRRYRLPERTAEMGLLVNFKIRTKVRRLERRHHDGRCPGQQYPSQQQSIAAAQPKHDPGRRPPMYARILE